MAKIRASMKDKSYSVKLTLDGNGGIVEGSVSAQGETGYVAIWQLQQYI